MNNKEIVINRIQNLRCVTEIYINDIKQNFYRQAVAEMQLAEKLDSSISFSVDEIKGLTALSENNPTK